jgi:hypothetical protein
VTATAEPGKRWAWIQITATARRAPHLFRGGGASIRDVAEDGVVEENRVLRHNTHVPAERLLPHAPQVLAVQHHRPGCGVVESEDQPQHGGLAAACGAHERDA